MELNHKIIITGGNGRFGSILKNIYKSNRLFYPNKKELNKDSGIIYNYYTPLI